MTCRIRNSVPVTWANLNFEAYVAHQKTVLSVSGLETPNLLCNLIMMAGDIAAETYGERVTLVLLGYTVGLLPI